MDPSPGHSRPVPASSPSRTAGASDQAQPAAPGPELDAEQGADMTTAHLARFEFSDQGTKILMVEWHPGAVTEPETAEPEPEPEAADSTSAPPPASDAADWHISWPGKSTVLPASESDRDQDGARRRRVYFLLPTDASVPGTITVAGPAGRPALELKPLPAIFPDGFHFEAGPRGVLHTIWAKKRLSELDREMDAELRINAEGVGLEMVRAERQWIVDNFLPPAPSPGKADSSGAAEPASPRSPGAGRLSDKLKGLRLATAEADLVPSPTANTFTEAGAQSLTLSPTGGDVAVSSFAARPAASTASAPMSLNAALHGGGVAGGPDSQDTEDELFALPMSPRSPDMKKSPFSMR